MARHLSRFAAAATTLGMVTIIMTAQPNSNNSLEASPTSGTAPLVVTFTGTGSGIFEVLCYLISEMAKRTVLFRPSGVFHVRIRTLSPDRTQFI